jgi:hypothetical protein
MRQTRLASMLLLVVAMGLGTACFADLAIKVTPVDWINLGYQANQGWEFVANRAITVTHLGLYDGPNSGTLAGDGFVLQHPIGLWDKTDGSLLTSGTIPSGADTELLDGFRYIDLLTPVTLVPNHNYVVGCYSDTWTDGMWTWPQYFTWSADPAIEYVSAWWGTGTDLALPSTSVDDGSYRFGPNFQFTDTVVPVPGAVLLGIIGLSCAGWRLRRRTR